MLDDETLGHLCCLVNLSHQIPNDWCDTGKDEVQIADEGRCLRRERPSIWASLRRRLPPRSRPGLTPR
jgi:hypothetical protein